MTTKAAEKIIDALTQLMEGYCELQEAVENDYGSADKDDDDDDDESSGELNAEADAAIVNEMRAALEAVIEAEDYTPDEIASVISTMTDALEEIDPDVFEKESEDEDEEEYEDDDEDEDLEEYEEEEEGVEAGEAEEEEEAPRKPTRKR